MQAITQTCTAEPQMTETGKKKCAQDTPFLKMENWAMGEKPNDERNIKGHPGVSASLRLVLWTGLYKCVCSTLRNYALRLQEDH